MYVQPNGKYFIEIPKDGQITQFQSNNEIEILFYNLGTYSEIVNNYITKLVENVFLSRE